MIEQIPVPLIDGGVTLAAAYVSWQARQIRLWIESHEERTEANEVRSVFNRRVLSEDHDVDTLPPAPDPADDELATDGGVDP